MTSYFLLIHSRNECGGSILKNTVNSEKVKNLFFVREFLFIYLFL